MPKQTISDFLKPQATTPVSTNVHSNIDDLIIQSKLDEFAQTGVMYTTPLEYKGGVDDVVANVAMSPLLALKNIKTGVDLLKKINYKNLNPLTHFTRDASLKDIVKSGILKSPSYREGLSLTRDTGGFMTRPHKGVGNEASFLFDRKDLVKGGYKPTPFTEPSYKKALSKYTNPYLPQHAYAKQMNPRFEFEERLMSGKDLPIEKAKMINLISRKHSPFVEGLDTKHHGLLQYNPIRSIREHAEALSNLKNFNIPTVMSSDYAANLFKTINDIESYNKAPKSIKKLKDFFDTTPVYRTPKTWRDLKKATYEFPNNPTYYSKEAQKGKVLIDKDGYAISMADQADPFLGILTEEDFLDALSSGGKFVNP